MIILIYINRGGGVFALYTKYKPKTDVFCWMAFLSQWVTKLFLEQTIFYNMFVTKYQDLNKYIALYTYIFKVWHLDCITDIPINELTCSVNYINLHVL